MEKSRLTKLTLLALGVVYGDIGTSPLYAFRECFASEHALPATATNVYGVLSLIVWSLILIVAVKYITFIMRADNAGEGGILALLALILQQRRRETEGMQRYWIIVLGLIGAALLYGDGIITPAISVLGAVEGLKVVSPAFAYLVIPITIAILFGLFFMQKKGTAKVGRIFGPVMMLWFLSIGALGLYEIILEPHTLLALNPWYGVQLFLTYKLQAFILLGSVVLAVTGAEALYADMGHFGKRPIRLAWYALVMPCLLLNYFGQGALVLRDPTAAANPFYLLAPSILLYPLIILATAAAIIASQALISGAFSLTQQCVQLGYSPRVTIVHTSKEEAGQIYIPEVNAALMVGCLLVVLGFRSSSALGAAYGIAVTGTMGITTLLYYFLVRTRWKWTLGKALGLTAFFLVIDLSFFGANVTKIQQGGWVPLIVAMGIFILMTTWKRGRAIVSDILRRGTLPMDLFLEDITRNKPARVPGTAVFMTSEKEGAPVVLLHHLKHNKVLHEKVILLSVLSAKVPDVPEAERVQIETFPEGFYRITARYGFMQTPDVKEILATCERQGMCSRPGETTYYLGRERLLPTGKANLARWRKMLFIFMSRNSRSATEFFGIPPNRAVELGAQIEF